MNMYLFYNLKSLEKYILNEQEKLACSINPVEVCMFEKRLQTNGTKSALWGIYTQELADVTNPGCSVFLGAGC